MIYRLTSPNAAAAEGGVTLRKGVWGELSEAARAQTKPRVVCYSA